MASKGGVRSVHSQGSSGTGEDTEGEWQTLRWAMLGKMDVFHLAVPQDDPKQLILTCFCPFPVDLCDRPGGGRAGTA